MTMNSQDTVDRETHLSKLRADPEYREDYILEVVLERIKEGGDCYPYTPANILEAMLNTTDAEAITLSDRLRSHQVLEAGYDLASFIQDYWKATAIRLTKMELDNAN